MNGYEGRGEREYKLLINVRWSRRTLTKERSREQRKIDYARKNNGVDLSSFLSQDLRRRGRCLPID